MTWNASKLLVLAALVLMLIFVIGIFAKFTGSLYESLPFDAFACFFTSLLIP
jgi:hypothetical protein